MSKVEVTRIVVRGSKAIISHHVHELKVRTRTPAHSKSKRHEDKRRKVLEKAE